MDPNRLTEQQQPQSQLEEQRGRQPHLAASQSNTTAAGTSASHSDAFIPFPEPKTTRNDIAQSSVSASVRRVTSLDQEYDEARLTSSPSHIPISLQRSTTPDMPYAANTATSSSEVTPLPPAIVSSRRSTVLADNNANGTLHNAYNNFVSKLVPPKHESRRTSPGLDQNLNRSSSTMTRTGTGTGTEIVEAEKPAFREKTVEERLKPTLKNANTEKTKYAKKAQIAGYALNIAIGLQVVFGSLTTALSVVTKGSQTAIMTATLGGFSTIVAAYLARARGSNEPELSIRRTKDLEQFIRECSDFTLDHGHDTGHQYDEEIDRFRRRFETLLGNTNGDQKPPV